MCDPPLSIHLRLGQLKALVRLPFMSAQVINHTITLEGM